MKQKKEGNHLVAIVARDNVVKELKGRQPKNDEITRVNKLLNNKDIDLVVLGDPKIGTYNILKEVKPDIVFLGYDQKDLHKDLKQKIKNGNLPEFDIILGRPYKSDIFHSSILNNKK
jgi:FAD synthetase